MSDITKVFNYPIPNTTLGAAWPNEVIDNIDPTPLFDIYVDSVDGSDSNDGLTEATALKTISAITWENNIKVGVKYGSYFREQIIVDTYTGIEIDVYGNPEDKLPTFDAADVFDGVWTNDTGNIWYADITTIDSQYTMYNSLWKNGVRMEWVSNTGNLTTNDHYFVAEASTNPTYLARFYIYSDIDPNTNNALYEYASRHYGVNLGDNCKISRIRTKRQLHNNGSTIIGNGSQANFCIFEDGVKHNSYIGRNATAFECIAYKHDLPRRTNATLFVGHTQDGIGQKVSFYNCLAIAEADKSQWAYDNNVGVTGFYAHTSGASAKWDEIDIFDCTVANCNLGISVADVVSLTSGRNWIHDCYGAISAVSDKIIAQDTKITDETHSIVRGLYLENSEDAIIQRLRIYVKHPTNHAMIYDVSDGGKCIVQNSALLLDKNAPNGFNYFLRMLDSGRGIQLQNNIFYAYDRDCAGIRTPNSAANMWTPENYWGGTDNYDYDIGGVWKGNYPAALAEPSYGYLFNDNICVDYGPSCITDMANGDFTTVAGSDAANLNAGIGTTDDVVYKPIPTYAEIDAM
ncbi:tail spike protein [Ochrobactrum phage vB_OspM_OC]|nr:tail spike protein [Ochrobactrum phage vB_OspM_OC]